MKLYDYYRSSAAFRVRIALNLKGLTYQQIPIHLLKEGGQQHSPAYQAMNPQELIPALEDKGHVINQSLAIIGYLEEQFPNPSLLPVDPFLRAKERSLALHIACDIHPLNNLRVLTYLKDELKLSEEQKSAWLTHWMTVGFTAIEKELNAVKEQGQYCFGDTPSLADVCLIPQMTTARRFHVDLTAFPRMLAIEKSCLSHPAFIKALPANQADAE